MEEKLTIEELADQAVADISKGVLCAKSLDARSIIYRALHAARCQVFDDGIAYYRSKLAEGSLA